ncbi:MAG TPA: glycerophosphodiester phosphodiesterase [Pyrinomonadaceae bacterium]|nr:glycerophosphodiester phosphodiesterase [Pyrinomonadaceae bacterium]
MAHRGGAGLWPENTMLAFERARDLGVDVIETDVHSTADGVLVILHDATLERTTDGTGPVSALTLAQLKKLDAGFRFSADGGKTFPWRGRGVTVPTLDEVFTRLPAMRFNIEPKQESPSIVKPLCRAIREKGMAGKVTIGSFRQGVLDEFRKECPEVATSAGPGEVAEFMRESRNGGGAAGELKFKALQVPERAMGVNVLTRSFVESAHARALQVHAWTVNDPEAMRRLMELGVDGIMTDYPDRLLAVLGR